MGSKDKQNSKVSFLNLVDLAGSERIYRFETNANTINESKNINLSLLNLEKVILALEEGSKKKESPGFVPFRNSALTLFLKNCFQGSARISLIFTVNFSGEHIDETIATLRFALRCRNIQIQVSEEKQDFLNTPSQSALGLQKKVDFLTK